MSVYKRYDGRRVKRGDKNYDRARWYLRFKVRGRLYHQAIPEARTLEEAKQAENAVRQKIFSNKFNPAADKTLFGSFVETVYKPYVAENNVNTEAKTIFIDRLVAHFERYALREITPTDVRNYQTKRKHAKKKDGNPLAAASVNKELSTLSKIFTLAMQSELVERNPCAVVPKLREAKPRERLLDEDEEIRLWAEIAKNRKLFQIATVAVNTGLRKGQILAIRAEDIDFAQSKLKAAPSKGKDERFVPLNRTALAILREASGGKTGFIFTGDKTRRRLGGFKRMWENALKEAKIENFRFHDFRHVYASRLLQRGVHSIVVKDLLGHSEISTTGIYLNTDLSLLQDAVNRLDEIQDTDVLQ